MTDDPMTRVGEVLEQALACAPGDRGVLLDKICAGDSKLRAEVESLIASHELAGTSFLNDLSLAAVPAVGAGLRIGPYLIVDRIGRGGMGEVFAAVRADGQYEQKVALKVVRAGYASAAVVDRFRAERQILATLDHPNIARLLDGGASEEGSPYLVMELVDGKPIDEYCREQMLSVSDRLRLFLQVCSAVQYAHQRLVIHRDIKPNNILVTASGVPKLLDFGIAKMLDAVGTAQETMFKPFTPEYASPEQVRGEPVSTATDVYSLAVVLYELLTGRSPYKLETHTPEELVEAIKSRAPERPGPTPLRGDLDFILLKALRKEPDLRYASVEQFADDVRRHLDGLPVVARKGTWTYFAGKFVRRHRTAAAAAAIVLITLVAGIVVTLREARVAEANRRRADARFNDVRRLANSLIFEVHDSVADLPGATDTRKLILQRAVEYLDSLAKESDNEPDLMRELAYGYDRIGILQSSPFKAQLGDPKSAASSFQKSVALRESLVRSHPFDARDRIELARAYDDFAEFQSGIGNLGVGFDYAKRANAILDREAQADPGNARIDGLRTDNLLTLGMMQAGNGLMGTVGTPQGGVADLERATRLIAQAAERSPSDEKLRFKRGTVEIVIGEALLALGDRAGALAHYQGGLEALAPVARVGRISAASYNFAAVHGKIGDVLLIDGRTSEALPYYAEAGRLGVSLETLDPHNESLQMQNALVFVEHGHALVELGRVDEGVAEIRRGVAKIEADRTDTPQNRSMDALLRAWLGEALERQGRIREASREYAQTKERLDVVRKKNVEDVRLQGYYAAASARLASTLAKVGETDHSLQDYEEVRRLLEPVVKAHPLNLEPAYVLAETYAAEGTITAGRAPRGRTRQEQLADWTSARDWFRRSLDAWSRIPHPARISTSGFEVTMPQEVARRLASAEQNILRLSNEAS